MRAPSTLTDRAPSLGDALAAAGIVTDVHYADAPAEGTRVYRDSPMKVKDAVATFNKTGVDFVVSLGDFKVDFRAGCGYACRAMWPCAVRHSGMWPVTVPAVAMCPCMPNKTGVVFVVSLDVFD
jgi:hypothetical protein